MVADLHTRHVRSDGRDDAGAFVAGHDRQGVARGTRDQVPVRVAHPRGRHAHQDLTCVRRRQVEGDDLEWGFDGVQNSGT